MQRIDRQHAGWLLDHLYAWYDYVEDKDGLPEDEDAFNDIFNNVVRVALRATGWQVTSDWTPDDEIRWMSEAHINESEETHDAS